MALDIDVMPPSALSSGDLAEWRRLQAENPVLDSPFLSPGWALAVERAQQGERGAVRVAALREAGSPKGFIAARLTGSTAMPAGAPMCDYQGLVAGAMVDLNPRRLVQALGVDRLDFSHMLVDQYAFAPFMRGVAASYVVDLSQGYGAYEAQRRAAGSGLLKDIARRRRKVEREAGPARFTADARCLDSFAALRTWKRNQYRQTGQTDIFETGWAARLLEQLVTEGDGDFGGILFSLHIGDQLAAVQLNLRGVHTIHAWIIAHDPAFERYSPGLILFGEILRWMEGAGYATLDLGAGDYRFKLQMANAQRLVAHGFVGRPSGATLLRAAEYGMRSAAERLPLGAISALPGKAMRRLDILRALR
jgi:CelD/BcsL family acetyltransferase involved in cellulose biosynthesis